MPRNRVFFIKTWSRLLVFKQLIILFFVLVMTGCQYFGQGSKTTYPVGFEGSLDASVSIFSENEKGQEPRYTYIGKISGGQKIYLSPGTYLLENECSHYVLSLSSAINIKMSRLDLQLNGLDETSEFYTNIVCQNVSSNRIQTFNNKKTFYLLPGETKLEIVGKQFVVHSPEEQSKNFFIPLSSLRLNSLFKNDQTIYFLSEYKLSKNQKKIDTTLISNQVNKTIWIPKSKYEIEINGTKKIINFENNDSQNILLGAVQLIAPNEYQKNTTAQSLHAPIFAYLNNNILLQLNRKYSVFPDNYEINLANSQIKKNLSINTGEITSIQTYGAQIDPPQCDEDEKNNCEFLQNVLIHKQYNSRTLLSVPLGYPFLLFEDEYQYSLEGAESVMKHLKKSASSIIHESVGELKIDWKINVTNKKLETQKIEIESASNDLFGKSQDINSYKPRRLLLPTGQYRLISSLRQDRGLLSKKIIFANINEHKYNTVEIPIYAQTDQNLEMFFTEESESPDLPSTLIPVLP